MRPGRAPVQRQLFCRSPWWRWAGCGSTRGARVALPVFLTEDGLVTDAQVRRLREKRMAGKTLAAAAAAAGMSGRAARKATKPRCCPRCSPSATSAAR